MKFSFFKSIIGKKLLMSVMGMGLYVFLMTHLAGNMLLYLGKDVFNLYSHKLISNPFIYVLEGILLTGFLTHIYIGIRLTIIGKKARKEPYKVRRTLGKSNLFSSNMLLTGSVIFIFLVVHIKTFKYGPYIEYSVKDKIIRDLYTVVIQHFQMAWYAILYIVAILLLTFHLLHGVVSVPRTLGITSKGVIRGLKVIGVILTLIIGVGFISMPVYFWIFYP